MAPQLHSISIKEEIKTRFLSILKVGNFVLDKLDRVSLKVATKEVKPY